MQSCFSLHISSWFFLLWGPYVLPHGFCGWWLSYTSYSYIARTAWHEVQRWIRCSFSDKVQQLVHIEISLYLQPALGQRWWGCGRNVDVWRRDLWYLRFQLRPARPVGEQLHGRNTYRTGGNFSDVASWQRRFPDVYADTLPLWQRKLHCHSRRRRTSCVRVQKPDGRSGWSGSCTDTWFITETLLLNVKHAACEIPQAVCFASSELCSRQRYVVTTVWLLLSAKP